MTEKIIHITRPNGILQLITIATNVEQAMDKYLTTQKRKYVTIDWIPRKNDVIFKVLFDGNKRPSKLIAKIMKTIGDENVHTK